MTEMATNVEALLATTADRSDAVIVVHNTPDPDALGAAQALRALLATRNVESVICYQGPVYRATNQEMVRLLLNLEHVPQPDDAADAVAVAVCHIHSAKMTAMIDQAGGP